ncbi:hypothetical protein CVT24_007430 [Panaeolus cyanescens]|uniref:Uncharacterized protein n=1 Tax=Panaeolus cyanescens TaxID=181874 RepID=A0A409W9S0_9AGAR|nr:hypothetical protein CVT24_007430 [Panaeolus cyanescens]
MRLTNLVPEISQDIVEILGQIGIHTDVDLLLSYSDFELWKMLPKGTITLQQLKDLKRRVQPLCSAEGYSGKDILNLDLTDYKPLQLFSSDGEPVPLTPPIPVASVVEVSGDKGSGKTILALDLLIKGLLLSDLHTGIWVDTLGDFSMDNMLQAATKILERFQITSAFDVEALHNIMSNISGNADKPYILVIDSITPLFSPLLSPISSQGHAIMTEFLRNLHDFSRKSKCIVLVINDTASKGLDRTDRKPALGPSFALMTDTTLWLQKSPLESASGQTVYSVEVLKSRSMLGKHLVMFTIENGRVYNWQTADSMTIPP